MKLHPTGKFDNHAAKYEHIEAVPLEETRAFVAANNAVPPLTLRVRDAVKLEGLELEAVPDFPHAAIVKGGGSVRELAGFAEYRPRPHAVVFTHTEVDEAFEGQGIGGALVRGALDDVRSKGLAVVPLCPFVKAWIAKHPEYEDLVAA